MEKLTQAEEKMVNQHIAKEIIERLGYTPTKRRITNFVKKIVEFEKHEKSISISFMNT